MAKHKLEMSEPKHEVLNADIDFWIWTDGMQIGHLHVSKGGVDWFVGKSSIAKRTLSWEDLSSLMVANVSETRAARAKRKRK
jgi:hypothetical protein